jgi:hypothetical protein
MNQQMFVDFVAEEVWRLLHVSIDRTNHVSVYDKMPKGYCSIVDGVFRRCYHDLYVSMYVPLLN